jgi:DNA-binding response OmpR family regulator
VTHSVQKRALILEDDPGTSNAVESVLTSVGIESVKVKDSHQAVDAAQNVRFVVAFLGSQSGADKEVMDLTRCLRDSRYNSMTPVILLSADLRPKAMAEGFDAGATFFLYKPIEKERLLRLMRATHAAMEHTLVRRTRRVAFKSKVELWYAGQTIEAETINASMEGLLLKTPAMIPVGSSLDMRLHLDPTVPPLAASGSVVRIGSCGEIGVHLARLNMRESQRLEDCLLTRVPLL